LYHILPKISPHRPHSGAKISSGIFVKKIRKKRLTFPVSMV